GGRRRSLRGRRRSRPRLRRRRRPRLRRPPRPRGRPAAPLLGPPLRPRLAGGADGGGDVAPTAALAAVASALMVTGPARPWGLGFLRVVAYVRALLALIALDGARQGAAVAAVACVGWGAVADEAARGVFAGGHAAAPLLAAVPFALVGALGVRLRRARA